jgi:hypothetical protein
MAPKKPDEERITGTIKSIDGDVVTVVYQDPKKKNQEIDVIRQSQRDPDHFSCYVSRGVDFDFMGSSPSLSADIFNPKDRHNI